MVFLGYAKFINAFLKSFLFVTKKDFENK